MITKQCRRNSRRDSAFFFFFPRYGLPGKLPFREKAYCAGDEDDPVHLLKEFFQQFSLRLGRCSLYTTWERSFHCSGRQSLPLSGAEHAASAGLGEKPDLVPQIARCYPANIVSFFQFFFKQLFSICFCLTNISIKG